MSALLEEPRRVATLPTGNSHGVVSVPNSSRILVLGFDHVSIWDIDGGERPGHPSRGESDIHSGES